MLIEIFVIAAFCLMLMAAVVFVKKCHRMSWLKTIKTLIINNRKCQRLVARLPALRIQFSNIFTAKGMKV